MPVCMRSTQPNGRAKLPPTVTALQAYVQDKAEAALQQLVN